VTLHTLVERYIALQQALGKSYVATAKRLRSFVRAVGPDVAVRGVTRALVDAYLMPKGPLTRNYHSKYNALRGFFRYAHRHEQLDTVPLPTVVAKQPPPFQPHIYSVEELRRLLATIDLPRRRRIEVEPITLRTVVFLQYGAGLRISEALALDHSDVDLEVLPIPARPRERYARPGVVRLCETPVEKLLRTATLLHYHTKWTAGKERGGAEVLPPDL
jgi:integrase/recombinase XerD